MAITALPPAPSRAAPSTFSDLADAFLAALATFVTETNATAVAMNLNDTTDTSTTSVAIGTGAKSFTVSASKSFQPGMFIVIADTAAPSTNAMVGQITSYNSGTGALVVNVLFIRGSGTKTDWIITMTGGISTNQDLSTTASPTFVNVTGDLTGDVTGNVTGSSGSCTGNSVTATTATNVSGGSISATTGIFSSTVTAIQPYFIYRITSLVENVCGNNNISYLNSGLWTKIADAGSCFSSGTYTAQATGKHLLCGEVLCDGLTAGMGAGVSLVTSNRTYTPAYCAYVNSFIGLVSMPFSIIADMDVGDTAYIGVSGWNGSNVIDVSASTYFMGYQLP